MSSLINTESPLHTDALCVVVTLYYLALLMRFFVHVGCQLESSSEQRVGFLYSEFVVIVLYMIF